MFGDLSQVYSQHIFGLLGFLIKSFVIKLNILVLFVYFIPNLTKMFSMYTILKTFDLISKPKAKNSNI